MWQTVLLCHFHDVLPGSAIEMVFDDASKVSFDLYFRHSKAITEFSFTQTSSREDINYVMRFL